MGSTSVPGLEDVVLNDEETGFGAALFQSEINDETMLAYRGTNNGVTGNEDWKTNIGQSIGRETDQYNQAMDLAGQVRESSIGDSFSIVGHSLGGGLASAGVSVTGQPGYTYNSAGLHPETAARRGGLSNQQTGELIQTQAVDSEVLTLVQKHGNKALTAAMVGGGAWASGPLGATLGGVGGTLLPDIPQAVGNMRSLPSVKGGNPVARHGMDQVVDGIEAQKEEDIKMLSAG